jgi:hypothetical protein
MMKRRGNEKIKEMNEENRKGSERGKKKMKKR